MSRKVNRNWLLVFGLALTTACAILPAAFQQAEPQITVQTSIPTDALIPDPYTDAVMRVKGEEELVFDWSYDRCALENIPDLPARAFRDADGQVNLFLNHHDWYLMKGLNLDSLSVDCSAVYQSREDANPSQYSDREWAASVYTEDGQNLYVLANNEYQGNMHPGQCPQNDDELCLYNSITLMVSRDGGASFEHAAEPPAHLVASQPYPYEAGAGPYGMRAPSNIIKAQDGYYYAFLNSAAFRSDEEYVCLMRTQDLGDPASWRFWDGTAFEGRFINPYTEAVENIGTHTCPAFKIDQIGASLNNSITYNTTMERFVLVGVSADQIEGREVWGFYYSTSKDLITWTPRKLLMEMPLPKTVELPGSNLSYLYPSLLDPESNSQNFETTDDSAYLYYTRLNRGQGSLDRDLVRVPVAFFPLE